MAPELKVLQENAGGCSTGHDYISQDEATRKALQIDPNAALVKTIL